MKILVCTDGSKQSQKAIEAAADIAGGCSADEVAVIHVYENKYPAPYWGEGYHVTRADLERFQEYENKEKEKRQEILSEAEQKFAEKNIKVTTIFKEGHPAENIAKAVSEGGYDMVVIGSRGLGGLKKLFLGSVSNAVIQEVQANVLVVK